MDHLFIELYKLKSNTLMSSLRYQSPLEYPQMHSPSFPPLPSPGYRISKKEIEVWFFSAQAAGSQKDPTWLPRLGLNPSANLLTPPTTGHSCHHSHIFLALLGCHSKSRHVWPCGVEPIISKLLHRLCNQGELPPSYIMGQSHFYPPGLQHGHSCLTYP